MLYVKENEKVIIGIRGTLVFLGYFRSNKLSGIVIRESS